MNFLFRAIVVLNKKGEKKTTGEIMTFVVMAAVFMLYLPLVIVLLRNHFASPHNLPKEFALGTPFLLGTTWLLHLLKQCKENDQHAKLRRLVGLQVFLAFVFLLFQLKGAQRVFFSGQFGELKIIALLVLYHALHLCVLIGLFLKFLVSTRNIHSAADCYIYFLDPGHEFSFRFNIVFWNFLCLLWVFLYFLIVVKFD